MAFKIGLLGLGTVGTGTAQILLDPSGRNPLVEELEIYRVGVRNPEKIRPIQLPPGAVTSDLESIVTDPNVDIVVEVIGGLEPARSLILKAISHGKHVVTANKAVIARFGDEFGVVGFVVRNRACGIFEAQPFHPTCEWRLHEPD